MNLKAKRQIAAAGIFLGSLLTLAPFFGLIATMLGMMHAFGTLAGSGVTDPKALSNDIGTVLLSTAAGLFVLPIGIVLLVISLIIHYRLRATPPPLPPAAET